ncbi:MAG TPA: M23 family metallopeptidase [Trueperaceae bacterium]|nr:M23 family metallopeptidase [Trueperaceae bacterium]
MRPRPRSAARLAPLSAAVLTVALLTGFARAQMPPDADIPLLDAQLLAVTCPDRPVVTTAGFAPTVPLTPEQEAARERRAAYRALIPVYLAYLPPEPDRVLLMPVDGVRVSQVANTYAAPRDGGRSHQGQDIFAARHTPILSATSGIVHEISDRFTGGRGVMILGSGGVRYFYTHLEAYADDLREGMWVNTDTVIGYVGNDGNASTTPTHLHFGVYSYDPETCRHRAFDPLPLLQDR